MSRRKKNAPYFFGRQAKIVKLLYIYRLQQEPKVEQPVFKALLDVVATMNLIDNAAPLAECGIACVMCVEGAVDMFDPARFAFRPLKPELSMTSVLAWKKLSPYAGAAGKFLEYIKTIHSEQANV